METEAIKRILEGALLAAGRPLSLNDLEQLFTGDVDAPPRDAIRAALAELSDEWQTRSLALQEVASGFRAQVREEFEPWLARLWDEKPPRYSRALLETLAIIAYRQPITRSEIEDIRGVSVSTQIVRTLTEREWVRVVGHRDAPGRPAMYGTTRQFLDHFNLKTLDQLPELSELSEISSQHPELAFEAEPGANGAASDAAPAEGDEGDADAEQDVPMHEQAGEPTPVEVALAGADEPPSDGQADLTETGPEARTADEEEPTAETEYEAADDEEAAASDAEDDACTPVS